MAISRNAAKSSYDVGSKPPTVNWTVVKGDTASFKVYVTDDLEAPLDIPAWDIEMQFKRPNVAQKTPTITDSATLILTLNPVADPDDLPGEFTVNLSSEESYILRTGDFFDIQLSATGIVWTVAQGSMIILEDVTD